MFLRQLYNRNSLPVFSYLLCQRLCQFLGAVKFLRLHAFNGETNSTWTNRGELQKIIDAYESFVMPASFRAEFDALFRRDPGERITVDSIISQLLNDTLFARVVADRVCPVSLRIQDAAIRVMPRWAQEQTLRARLWQLENRREELKAEMKADGTRRKEYELVLNRMNELIRNFEEALEKVRNGARLVDNAFRRLLHFVPRLIDAIGPSNLNGKKPDALMWALETEDPSESLAEGP